MLDGMDGIYLRLLVLKEHRQSDANNSALLYVCCNHYRDQHSLVDKFDKKYPVE